MKTNRQLHEEAAGMNLEDSFFTMNGIDPDAFPNDIEEMEAMCRYFAGEEPTFSTGICGVLTAGYGECCEYGYWEFPLPDPCEQWLNPKSRKYDLKLKIGSLKFKVRIVDINSGEIIKRNYLHIHNEDIALEKHGSINEAIKQAELSGRLFITKVAGESVTQHPQRTYIEVVDEAYISTGALSYDFVQYSKKHSIKERVEMNDPDPLIDLKKHVVRNADLHQRLPMGTTEELAAKLGISKKEVRRRKVDGTLADLLYKAS